MSRVHPRPEPRPIGRFLEHHLERLLAGVLLLAAVGLLLARFEVVAPFRSSLLGLEPRFWLLIGAFYFMAQLGVHAATGIGHYAGWKKGLAVVDLALIAIGVHVTGGPISVVVPVFFLQVAALGLAHESEAASLRASGKGGAPTSRELAGQIAPAYLLWYIPALLVSHFLAAGPWRGRLALETALPEGLLTGLVFAQAVGIVFVALLVQGVARMAFRGLADEVAERTGAETAVRLVEEGTYRPVAAPGPPAAAAGPSADEREVMNWINLTAGLTHSIGNEIHAIDSYSSDLLDYLEDHPEVPADLREKVQFIHDTNQARFGFMSFLQEFAENMKSVKGRRPIPRNLKTIHLDDLIKEVREKVGRFESRELDPEDPDHQVQSQLSKNLALEIFTGFDPAEKRTITSGRQPVLEFVLYEFIKNALRNCSGNRKLKAKVEARGEWVTIQLINDLNVEVRKPPPGKPGLGCSGCKRIVGELYWLANSDFLDAYCDDCLREKVEANLGECWEPGKTSQWGKGLGLFVIRYFLEKYYFGKTDCSIIHWPTREVTFQLTIPDDLQSAIERHNARFDTKAIKRVHPAAAGSEES